MANLLFKRDGFWHFVRRVPSAFSEYDERSLVRQSTGVRVADDPRGIAAKRVASDINGVLEKYWRTLVDGRSVDAQRRYDAARSRARQLGFSYELASDLAARLPEVAARLDALDTIPDGDNDPAAVAALLGGEGPPPIKLSELVGKFEAAERSGLTDLSPDQMRKWRNPKNRAVANLIEVVGSDKFLNELTVTDVLDFRDWWQNRVVDEDLKPDTANKDIGALNKMLRTLNKSLRLGLPPLFSEMRLAGSKKGQRVAFPISFIQERLLVSGLFDDLNDEARHAFYLIVETGLRLSEAVNLTAETIRLDDDIPHVQVRPDMRRMKTDDSLRDIPLVGVALEAMRLHPNGFPRYRDKAASLSALVNQALRVRNLRPMAGQSFYSLRHSFEDRLTAVEAPEKLIANLMGHALARPKYGFGPSLAQKRKWLQRIAFSPPATV